MKRKILSVAGIFFIFASLLNVSCQNETPTVQDFALDTVLTLDKAEVSATAYPGMNFVSWLPVTNANSYVLYIYVGGNCISSKTYAFDDDLNYVDTNIKNDVEYTYFVEAESSSSTGRAVVTQNSMSDGNTVKAIVPPYNTKAFELANYETNKNNDFIVNSSNTNISSLKNKVSVSFPGKAYLTYEVSLIEQWSNDVYQTQYLYDAANNNVTLYTDFTVTQPGDYKVKIVAKSINSHFADSGVIKSDSSTRVYSQFLTAKFFYENYDEYESITVENTGNDNWNKINLPTVPYKYGYNAYWDYGTYKGGDSYTLTETNRNFYPYYELALVEVQFKDENYNEIVTPITKTLADDGSDFNTITLPEIPEKEGFVSTGLWYDNSQSYYDEGENLTLNYPTATFYADYLEVRKAVFYDENGTPIDNYTISKIENNSDSYWSLITFPSIDEKDGYVAFWQDDLGVDYAPNSTTQLGNPVTNYTVNYRLLDVKTVNFYDENGTLLESISLTESLTNDAWNMISLPSITEREGYIASWIDNYGNVFSQNTSLTINSDSVSFTVSYREKETRQANFLDEDGIAILDPITVTESTTSSYWNEIYLPSIPAKDGYIIAENKWYDNEGNSYSPNSYYNLIATTTNFTAKYINIETITMTMDQYYIGNLTSNEQTQYFYFNCTAENSYTVSWLDSYDGNSELSELITNEGLSGTNVDVKVSIYSYNGSQQVISNQDNGFTQPVTFTANETGIIVIEVVPYSSGNTGYYAVKVN